MKSLFVLLFAFFSLSASAQTKTDSVPPADRLYTLKGNMDFWSYVIDRIRRDPKLSGERLEVMVDAISKNLIPVQLPKIDSTQKKKQ